MTDQPSHKYIDDRAIVHKKAHIGSNVSIAPYAIVEADTEIGDDTIIDSHAMILNGARIGKSCHIGTGAIISAVSQDKKYKNAPTQAHISDKTDVREYVTVSRATNEGCITRVGKDNLLMAYTHVAHDCVIGDHCILSNAVQVGGHALLQNWVIVGALTGIHQFARIGTLSMIGSSSRVTVDVPPYSLVSGNRLRWSGLNVIGLRRRDISSEVIEQLKIAYSYIYQDGLVRSKAFDYIRKEMPSFAQGEELISFISDSKRGIVRAAAAD